MATNALLLIELASVAAGVEMADAMVKRAPVETFRAGTVQPGRFLILVGGTVAAVEEAQKEAKRYSDEATLDALFLPNVHPDVYESVGGKRRQNQGDALGVIETASVIAIVRAADRALKTAQVQLIEIRLGNGLGGKGLVWFAGSLEEVQAALDAGKQAADVQLTDLHSVIVPSQHPDIRKHFEKSTEF